MVSFSSQFSLAYLIPLDTLAQSFEMQITGRSLILTFLCLAENMNSPSLFAGMLSMATEID